MHIIDRAKNLLHNHSHIPLSHPLDAADHLKELAATAVLSNDVVELPVVVDLVELDYAGVVERT